MKHTTLLVAAFLLAPCAAGAADSPTAKGVEFFEKKIRPALVEHCYQCHSAEAKKTRGGLALDTRAGLRDGGDTGPAIVPGEPAKSLLLKALRHEGTLKMPNEQKKLPDAVLADFETWVKMGAPDPRDGKTVVKKGIDYEEGRKHWAYQPVKVTPPSAVRDAAWPVSDLDRHVLARLEAKGVQPAPDAAPHTWLRRVTFDLTGLPPTPEEVAAFESAVRAKPQAAIEEVVDRLLKSPRFGEHWARHWLDGVRFDLRVATVDRYRDWVVRALNADLPYDQFLTMQLAGDLLSLDPNPERQDDRHIATQFLALALQEMDPVEGMVEVVGQQLLGVSINCAKCHDHKFDAFSQQDYYALAGVFTSSRIAGNKNPATDGIPLPGDKARVLAVTEGKAVGDTNLLIRGEKTQRGPTVPRRFPAVLAGDQQKPLGQATRQSGRLELARWVADPANPLTARVLVNRVWQRLFGTGIVATPNDFGAAGQPPSHPELLDYLADRLVREGWSLKKLMREVVLSRTYRQSSAADATARAADPENRLLARAAVRRLTYEQIIDSLDAVGGVLALGVPPRPKNNLGLPRFAGGRNQPATTYRALYHDDPVLRGLFDGADPDLLTDKREASVTAPQMLFFLNNPQVIALAGKVARRAEGLAASTDPDARVAAAYRLLFARPPSERELEASRGYLTRNTFDRLCHTLLCSSEFIYLE